MAKKVLGYIFIVIAGILALTLIGQLTVFLKTVFGIVKIFSGNLDSYEIGRAIGSFIYCILHVGAIILLWSYGRKWIKKTKTS